MKPRLREPVLLANDYERLIGWYQQVLGFEVADRFEDENHYCVLKTPTGEKLGIALASEVGVEPQDRSRNTLVLQIQVDDVKSALEEVEAGGGKVTTPPMQEEKTGYWFGAVTDPEGNPCWIVSGDYS
ncbi:Glyoxalase-like domain protein [Maioricimonas rarisocia]|uniref:Glyoxalase-like domain protein n=1 Tax=Maioricimonas rarisocia TaxID=2528026 RepID=A0A517YZW5_9PLAN|nr:VOC family protein [Maioricimonas rarisocia]QDU35780.1 Glyoxalase-like domain protein [Maioricimonas rarisocia]